MRLDGWLLAVCAARTCMTSVFMTYAAVLPVLRTEWGMSGTAAGSVSTGFQAGYAVSLMVFSALADRVGARRVFLYSAWLSAVSALAFGVWARSYMTNGTVLHGRHGAIFLSRYGQPLVIKSDLKPPPDGQLIEYLGISNCYAVTVPEQRVEDDIVAHFVESIRARRQPRCGIDVGMHVAEQQMMAYESARTGRAIDLTTTFDLWWAREPAIMDLSRDWL